MKRRGRPPRLANPNEGLQKIIEEMEKMVKKGEYPAISTMVETILNHLMLKEQEAFLEDNPEEYRNGFYSRIVSTHMGNLNLEIPRVRTSNSFRPSILPKRWKRVNKEYEEFILALLANGYSKAKIKSVMENLDIPYSEDAMERVEDLVKEKMDYFKIRKIPDALFALYVDAYHTEIKDENQSISVSLFVAVGIDLSGYKNIYGFWVVKGRENISFWNEVFQDMISRGLSRVLILITDHFSGIEKLVRNLFPLTDHQFCLVHLYRNLKNKLNLKNMKEFYKLFQAIKHSQNYEEGKKYYKEMIEKVREINPNYAKYLEKYEANYLSFLKYPENVRKYIYTTNIVESINSGLEYMRNKQGGFFNSMKMLEINTFIQLANLHDKWLDKPNPTIASESYRIRQLFTLKFETEELSLIDL